MLTAPVALSGCSDDADPTDEDPAAEETGDGDGDGDSGDGDGDSGDGDSGDGDGDSGDGDGDSGDGDGDSGDGDGDPGDGDGDSGDGDGDPGDGDGDVDLTGEAYDLPGPYAVTTSSGQMQATPQCDLAYDVYEPATLDSDISVFLAHGMMRSIEDMAEVAEHIASWGVTVYAVPLCTNSIFGVNHQQNGEAIIALGEALAPDGAVYSGFSAGGLAAWIAAAGASNAVAFVGLDAVDRDGIALGVAANLSVPVRGSIAEPSMCNETNNFLPVYDAIGDAPVMRIVGAQHFDFEGASCNGGGDFTCSFCAPAGPETHALALGMSTAAILIETGADLGGLSWWEPGGSYFDMYAAQGDIMLLP